MVCGMGLRTLVFQQSSFTNRLDSQNKNPPEEVAAREGLGRSSARQGRVHPPQGTTAGLRAACAPSRLLADPAGGHTAGSGGWARTPQGGSAVPALP